MLDGAARGFGRRDRGVFGVVVGQRGKHAAEHAMGFDVGVVNGQSRLGQSAGPIELSLPGVKAGEFGCGLGRARVELARALVRGNGLVDGAFAFQVPSQQEFVIRLGSARADEPAGLQTGSADKLNTSKTARTGMRTMTLRLFHESAGTRQQALRYSSGFRRSWRALAAGIASGVRSRA